MAFPGGFLYNRNKSTVFGRCREVPRLEELVRRLTQAAGLCRKYGLAAEELDHDAVLVQDYRVRVALLGAFNTGKSALLNALLGTPLVQVSVQEETSLPVEVFYGTQGITVQRGGRACRADPTVLRSGGAALDGAEMARACLPLPALASLPGISLLDTPGIGTYPAAHNAGLPALVRQAGAYILVFGADAPVITESMAAFLATLPLTEKPLLCVLTKADQFSPGQLDAITEYLEHSLKEQLGVQARLCRVCCTAESRLDGVPEFLAALQVRAGEMQAAEARRCLAAGITPLIRYLEERLQNSRLLEPELARKADLLDDRLARLRSVVDDMNERAARLTEQAAADAADHCRETLAPLAGPLAEMPAAGQDPAPFADGTLLSVLRAEARSRIFPVLESYEKAMHRLASLYGLTLPDRDSGRDAFPDSAFSGTGPLFAGGNTDPAALLDALQGLVRDCLTTGSRQAFASLREALSRPLYDQLASLRKALEDTRRQQHEQAEASSQSLEELQADLTLLHEMMAFAGEEGQSHV